VIGNLRFLLVIFLTVLVVIVLAPFQFLGLLLERFGWLWLVGMVPVVFHRILLKLWNVRLTLDGELSTERPLLLVSNHVSWLDIVVLGAVAPVSFVAKSEIRNWPVFGILARLQRTVFVSRVNRRMSGEQVNEIAERMTERAVMVLFPEGTTTDGNQLAPFKTTLFEAAKIALDSSLVETAIVQPAAINYTHFHGLPFGRADRTHIAWPGDVGLVESFVPVIKHGALDVTFHLGSPIKLDQSSNRKVVAGDAAEEIRTLLDSSRLGG
jgi:1-acyl-sn-glycerol-3-phosphate acyltransferase